MRYFVIGLLLIISLAAMTACTPDPARRERIEYATEMVSAGLNAYTGVQPAAASPAPANTDLAPAYTRLAKLRTHAATALDNNTITVQTAVDIQAVGDSVRDILDQARGYDAAGNTAAASANLEAAIIQLTRLEGLLP